MKEVYKYLKITCKTPKGQASKVMKMQRDALLGYKKVKEIKEEKLVNDHKFYWIVPAYDENDMTAMSKRIWRGEIAIKGFYSSIFKLIKKVNKLMEKGDRGIRLAKTLIKRANLSKDKDPKKMSDAEFKEFLVIQDYKEMEKLLSGELMRIDYLDP